MRVHLIKRRSLEEFGIENVQSRRPLEDWVEKMKRADWSSPANIQETFGAADLLGSGSNRVVFDIGGNNYRLICKYLFGIKQVHLFVCWIGTHAEYDKLCKGNGQYTINIY